MFCPDCGKEIMDEQAGCPYCAAAANEQANAQQNGQYENPNQYYQPRQDFNAPQPDYSSIVNTNSFGTEMPVDRSTVTEKEFFDKYAPLKLKKDIKSICIVTYVLCALNLVLNLFVFDNPWGIIEIAIIAAVALGMQLGKNKVFAILFLIVGIIECVLSTILSGSLVGWLWIVMGITAVSTFSKIGKQYKQFKLEGMPMQNDPNTPNNMNM